MMEESDSEETGVGWWVCVCVCVCVGMVVERGGSL